MTAEIREYKFLDITMPDHLEIKIDKRRHVVWINIDGVCVLRACRIGKIEITEEP